MSRVSLLQNFANALLGIRNAAMDIYVRWEADDSTLGPRRVGPRFEDFVSGPTDISGLWAWFQETGVEIDEEEFKSKVEEEGIDAFRPDEVHECNWQEDIATGIEFARDIAGRGLCNIIVPPSGKDSKQWLMEVILCAEEAKNLVVLAGLTPTVLECDSALGNCENPAAANSHNCVKQRHDQVEQLPAVADRLMGYRQWILTQLCVEATPDCVDAKTVTSGTGSPATSAGTLPRNDSGKFGYQWLVSRLPAPATLEDALDGALNIVEPHRLLFLYFAEAHRINPLSTQGTCGIRDTVHKDKISGWDVLVADIDDDGGFLFRNRIVLERFAQTVVRQFGSGIGCKPCVPGPDGHSLEVEGGSMPYWSIDEEIASYLEESADAIIEACRHLRSKDVAARFRSLITSIIDVAHDNDQPRWYASGYVHWEYLSRLDSAILAIKRAAIEPSRTDAERIGAAPMSKASEPSTVMPARANNDSALAASGSGRMAHTLPDAPPTQVIDNTSRTDRLSIAESNIISTIRENGRRITTTEILRALERKYGAASEGTTKTCLAGLVRRGLLNNRQDVTPKGYGLPDWK
jgi:hypothetical protein